MKKKSFMQLMNTEFQYDPKHLGIFFLGFGVALFILNITSMASVFPYFNMSPLGLSGPMLGYYMSAIASVLLIAYASYNIHMNK